MAKENLFYKEIDDGIYLISTNKCSPNDDPYSLLPGKATTNSYLVIGSDMAVLFDLAVDDEDLFEYACKLSGKKTICVLSHAHYDHVYNINKLDEVYLHPNDEALLHGGFIGTIRVEPMPRLHFLQNGDRLDLGERILDVIHIPGHTMGSILLLDRKSRILLSGDTGARRLLFGTCGFVPFDDFTSKLEELKNLPFDIMYSAHDRCPIPKSHIDRMINTINNELPTSNKIVHIPGVGELICASTGNENEIGYFDVAVLKSK